METYRKIVCRALLMLSAAVGIFLFTGREVSASEAVELPLDGKTWIPQEINSDDDIRYWELNVPSDGKVEVSVQAFRDDTYWCLYDQEKTKEHFHSQINQGSASIPGNGSQTWYLSRGIYYLMAKDNRYQIFKSAGNVQMKALFTPADNTEIEPNNTWTQAMSLEAGKTVRGILTDYGDREDFYEIQVEKKGEVTFHLAGMFEGVTLDVYRQNYTSIEKKSLYGGTETSPKTGTWTMEMEPGTYYLKIGEDYVNKDPSGVYELSWDPPYIPVTAVFLDKNEILLTKKGQEAVLRETVQPAEADNKNVEWKSDNNSVAVVDQTGKVTAISDGTATITVTTKDKGFQAECKVEVKLPNLKDAKLKLSKTTYAYTGKSITPPVTVTYQGTRLKEGTDYKVSYKNNVKVGQKASVTVTGKGSYIGKQTITFQIAIDTKKTYESKGLKYKIASVGKKTAQVVGVKSVGKSSITIPATVKILGGTYKVERIQAKAFQKNKKVKTIIIGKNIKAIDAKAFYGCSKLSKLQVKSKVLQKVGDNALKGTKKNIRIELPKKYYQNYKKLFEKKGQAQIRFAKK